MWPFTLDSDVLVEKPPPKIVVTEDTAGGEKLNKAVEEAKESGMSEAVASSGDCPVSTLALAEQNLPLKSTLVKENSNTSADKELLSPITHEEECKDLLSPSGKLDELEVAEASGERANDESFITCEEADSDAPKAAESEVWFPVPEDSEVIALPYRVGETVVGPSPERRKDKLNANKSNESFRSAYESEEEFNNNAESPEDSSLVNNEMLSKAKAESMEERKEVREERSLEPESTKSSVSGNLRASQLQEKAPEFKLVQKATMTPKQVTLTPSEIAVKSRLSEKDREQVQKDIGRSMNNFDYFNSLNEESAADYKAQLKQMLIELLSKNDFHYYQGYNELCSVFLLILGKKQGIKAAEVTSYYLIKDFLLDSFEKGVQPLLFMLNDLLKAADKELYETFAQMGVGVDANVGSPVHTSLVTYLVCAQRQ
eukprot:TRINITY_DN2235_c0_g1_i5.p1 TRINITY_DN2235_c0_g1~~TRINITY_DN2235_c0_g1_i5.p1  ORF type:complete len:429 (+),score=125.95 TRINITY_DN2235_c0_g1_i5:320-1606(+)